jgi:hypothetical protein
VETFAQAEECSEYSSYTPQNKCKTYEKLLKAKGRTIYGRNTGVCVLHHNCLTDMEASTQRRLMHRLVRQVHGKRVRHRQARDLSDLSENSGNELLTGGVPQDQQLEDAAIRQPLGEASGGT